mmetsp:Transcript_5996/g.11360  ORF Transcript_5996/g.11360 Transcript_5996/m.11360 type:complete len:218 (-) Transcript_5996:20-673(-)
MSLSMYTTPSRWSYSCWNTLASKPVNFFLKVFPLRFLPSILIHFGLFTRPCIPGKLRHPSSSVASASAFPTISGLTHTVSSIHFDLSPLGLYTMRRLFTPTWGAARPTPLAAYIIRNISLARDAIVPSAISSSVHSAFFALSAGCGYLTILLSVPSTAPGSTSSSTDLSSGRGRAPDPEESPLLDSVTSGSDRGTNAPPKRRDNSMISAKKVLKSIE